MMAKRHPIVDMTFPHITRVIAHRLSELMVNHIQRLSNHQSTWMMA
jgi:hypothetical protein